MQLKGSVDRRDVPALASLHTAVGGTAGSIYVLQPRDYTLGRSRDCDIVLKHPSVSRLHARLACATVALTQMHST